MKKTSIMLSASVLVFVAGCSDNKSSTSNTQLTTEKVAEKAASQTANSSSGDGIVGTWEMTKEAFDKNENKILDDDERKAATGNRYRMEFSADGTCRTQNYFSNTYKVRQEGGEKILEIQRHRVEGEETKDPPPDIYKIKSLTKDEMVLLVTDAGFDMSFWIFDRLR